MADKGYNGWSNYETWNVKLWIDNDEGSYNYWRERVRACWEVADNDRQYPKQSRKDRTLYLLSEELKSQHEENRPETVGVYADLLGAALSEVNWYEIAEAMVTDEELEEDAEESEVEAAR